MLLELSIYTTFLLILFLVVYLCYRIHKRIGIQVFKIASPCTQYWGDFEGDGKTRHCSLCRHDVHNVCNMSKSERNELLERRGKGERVCVYIEPSFIRKGWYFAGAVVFALITQQSYKSYMKDKYNHSSGMLAEVLDETKFQEFNNPN